MNRVFVVAEVGCNHNGCPEMARSLVEEAAACGVDAVKFQAFRASDLISRFAPKAAYQRATTGDEGSQLEMTRALELPWEVISELTERAESLGLTAFSAPFDLGSISYLEAAGQRIWKIPSGEVTDLPYLERVGAVRCPGKEVLLSTGMATLTEVSSCVDVLVAAGTDPSAITLLHCNTEYPTPDRDVNVGAMAELAREFPGHRVGLSDHSVGSVAAVMAVALGATVIEKHFTLDRALPGPDHRASATPGEMRELVESVRRAEVMRGSGRKLVTPSERGNMAVARRSVVASRPIRAGEKLTADNVTCKRPGTGISPMFWYKVLGQRASRDFAEDELIEVEGLPWQG